MKQSVILYILNPSIVSDSTPWMSNKNCGACVDDETGAHWMFEMVRFYTINFPMSINLKNPTSFRVTLLKIPFAKCSV